MKPVAFALLPAALLAAAPAAAQSLHETHEIQWMPAGKSPPLIHRLKDRPDCAGGGHHQAGKAPLPAANPCRKIAAKPGKAKLAAATAE